MSAWRYNERLQPCSTKYPACMGRAVWAQCTCDPIRLARLKASKLRLDRYISKYAYRKISDRNYELASRKRRQVEWKIWRWEGGE